MSIGERIEERRKAAGIPSQSELARRAEMHQSTLSGLIRKPYRWSPHLTRLARELRTTVDYLVGETDNPESEAPAAPELSFDERELLDCFRVLTPTDRQLVQQLVRSLAGRGGEPKAFARSVHAPKLEYHGGTDK